MILLFNAAGSFAQNRGVFSDFTDIGNPRLKGSAVSNDLDQVYTLKGSGANIWANRDEFQFASQQQTGYDPDSAG
jgi:hypothetical protein